MIESIINKTTQPKPTQMNESALLPNQRSMKRIEPHTKVVLALFVSIIWFFVTKGRPPNMKLLQGLSHEETTTEEVFQTVIAVQKKRFTKRIIEAGQGYWSYIPYMNQPRWIDLEIRLTTKIGYDIKNGDNVNIGVNSQGRPFIEIFEPTVIDKHWVTEIIDTSENIFNKWDIRQYKSKEQELLQAIAQAESQNMLEEFKSDPGKMSELAHRLDQKLLMKQNFFLNPLNLLDKINKAIDSTMKDLRNFILSPSYRPETGEAPRQGKSTYPEQSSTQKGKLKAARPKRIKYTPEQNKMRQEMKNQLNL